jgi:hypothetical protein
MYPAGASSARKEGLSLRLTGSRGGPARALKRDSSTATHGKFFWSASVVAQSAVVRFN